MKRTQIVAMITLLFLAVGGAAAQSLGDAARAARKNKPEPSPSTRHYDNDNLPTNETLSIVGPAPAAETATAGTTTTAAAAAPGATNPDKEKKKVADEWKEKLDKQKQKIDALSKDLDLEQREFRLKEANFYADGSARIQNAAQFDKDGAQTKSDIEDKQKAIEAAKQEYDEMQEQARKAGIVEKDKDKSNDVNKDAAKDDSTTGKK
jgi:hypothetical protein